jgi:hypothetical protein
MSSIKTTVDGYSEVSSVDEMNLQKYTLQQLHEYIDVNPKVMELPKYIITR